VIILLKNSKNMVKKITALFLTHIFYLINLQIFTLIFMK